MIDFDFFSFINVFFTIFLVLNSQLKLAYYKNNDWKERFINKICKTITDLYENQYASVTIKPIEDDNLPKDDLFNHIYKKRRLSNENELDLYLGTPIVPGEVNLLQWWKV